MSMITQILLDKNGTQNQDTHSSRSLHNHDFFFVTHVKSEFWTAITVIFNKVMVMNNKNGNAFRLVIYKPYWHFTTIEWLELLEFYGA